MAGTIVVDRLESDASYASSINIASPVIVSSNLRFSNSDIVIGNTGNRLVTGGFNSLTVRGTDGAEIYFGNNSVTTGRVSATPSEVRITASQSSAVITFMTNSTERIRIPSDAGGIQFPATQSASSDPNTLDDYEEGTWTPVLSTTGTNFSSVSYNTTNTRGTYTKIGDTVFFRGVLLTTGVTVGSASGIVQISGLPFTSQSVAERPAVALAEQGQYGGWNTTPISGSISSGAAAFLLNKLASLGGSQSNLAAGDVGTGGTGNFFMFSGQYKIA